MYIAIDEKLNYKGFNENILPQFDNYLQKRANEDLQIDFEGTTFISPSVLCDLLSMINYVKDIAKGRIYLYFGYNPSLISFLRNTDFFMMADVGKTVFTDVIDLRGEDSSYTSYSLYMMKRNNTEKIRRINLPKERDDDYGKAHEIIYYDRNKGVDKEKERISSVVQQDFWTLYSKKRRAINSMGIDYECCEYLANAYSEIVINSYFHGGHDYCFYTFQNYKNTGLSFVSSDTGMGYHDSFVEKIYAGKRLKGLFSNDDFLRTDNRKIQSLMSIVEGLLYRYFNPKQVFDHGILDIVKIILGVGRNNNAIIRIQSDYAMLQLDAGALPWLFDGVTHGTTGVYFNIVPKLEMFKEIVTNNSVRAAWERSGHIVYSDFRFPGVHISATIDAPKKERS